MKNENKINDLIIKALESGKMEITDTNTLIKVMEFQQKYLESRCEKCEHRLRAGRPERTIEDALKEFLS